MIKNSGQEFIDNSKEPIYFPLLDRKETLFFEKINKFYVDNTYLESVRNYNLCNVGVFQWISESFLLSLSYGSITHLKRVKILMKVLLRTLVGMYDDYEFKIELFGLAITTSDKELASYILKSESIIGIIGPEEIEFALKMIRNIEFQNNRLRSLCYLLRYFSDYFDEFKLNSSLIEFKGEVIKWLNQDNSELNLEKPIFEALKK